MGKSNSDGGGAIAASRTALTETSARAWFEVLESTFTLETCP